MELNIVSSYFNRDILKLADMGKDIIWVPGYEPEQCGAPTIEKNFKKHPNGIQAAYREAHEYVEKKPLQRFCTIGPKSWLRCWEKANEEEKIRVKRTSGNVVLLCDRDDLMEADKEFKKSVEEDYKWKYLYY